MANSKMITRNDIQNILAHVNLGDDSHKEVTQAQFDALTQAQKDDGTIYFITDGVSRDIFLNDNVPIGTIAPYGGTADPAYWLICDGRAVSRTTYADLFAVIGTAYGTGDGSTTFNIPDLKGRVSMGASENYNIGTTGGEATHKLTVDEMPSHRHSLGGRFSGVGVASGGYAAGMATDYHEYTLYTGGGTAHNNLQPYTVTNYIIKVSSAISENQSHLDFFYPVGSYYETSDSTFDPNIKWGGTWEKEAQGKVHVSAGSTYTIGSSYGSDTHTHTTGNFTLQINHIPAHSHTVTNDANYTWLSAGQNQYSAVQTLDQGTINTGSTGGGQAHNHGNTGSSTRNSWQPSIAVNRWHRIA